MKICSEKKIINKHWDYLDEFFFTSECHVTRQNINQSSFGSQLMNLNGEFSRRHNFLKNLFQTNPLSEAGLEMPFMARFKTISTKAASSNTNNQIIGQVENYQTTLPGPRLSYDNWVKNVNLMRRTKWKIEKLFEE